MLTYVLHEQPCINLLGHLGLFLSSFFTVLAMYTKNALVSITCTAVVATNKGAFKRTQHHMP